MKKETTTFLTPKEFVKLPLSEAIPFVIEDIKRFHKKGVAIQMDNWAVAEREKTGDIKLCSVCAGGAAVMGFYNGELPDLLEKLEDVKSCGKTESTGLYPIHLDGKKHLRQFEKIAETFDEIRQRYYPAAIEAWTGKSRYSFSDKLSNDLRELMDNHTHMYGTMDSEELKILFKQMREFAAVLKKYNL